MAKQLKAAGVSDTSEINKIVAMATTGKGYYKEPSMWDTFWFWVAKLLPENYISAAETPAEMAERSRIVTQENQEQNARFRESLQNNPNLLIRLVNTPIKGIGLTATDIAGIALLAYGSYEAARVGWTAFLKSSLTRNLNSWSKSVGIELDAETKDNFINNAMAQLDKKWLSKQAITTIFKPTKGVFTVSPGIAQEVSTDIETIVKRDIVSLIPRATQTGAMAFGGLPKEVPPITPAIQKFLALPEKEILKIPDEVVNALKLKGFSDDYIRTKMTIPEMKGALTPVTPVTPTITKPLPKVPPVPVLGGIVPPVTPEITKLTGDTWDRMVPIEREQLGIRAKLDAERRGKRWIELFPEEKRALIREYKKEVTAIPKAEPGIPYTPTQVDNMKAELEGLKATLASDPVATARFKIGGKTVDLTFFKSIAERELPDYFTIKQAEALMPGHVFAEYMKKGTPQYNHIPRDVAFDDLSKRFNMSSDEIQNRVMAISKEKVRVKELESALSKITPEMIAPEVAPPVPKELIEKPLEPLPEPTPAQIIKTPTDIGVKNYTIEQIDVLNSVFAEYIENPTTVNAWELTRELRRETRAGRAENLKARAQQLIVDKGISAEDAMKQAITETLSGELPALRTEYLEQLTNDMRDALFIKVYHTLKDEPYEMASTVTALTNALTGRPIPREPGVMGGSAYTRLQRVFGTQPKVLKAIDKIASEKKPLKDVVEGIYHETGRPPIPIDQGTADYLRGLKTDILYQPTAFIEPEPVTPFEAPIEDAWKQVPLLTFKEKQVIVRTLKGLGMTAVDIGNLIRANVASFDMSFWRQVKTLVIGNPGEFYKANIEAFKALWSQRSAEANWVWVLSRPSYPYYAKMVERTGQDFLRMLVAPKGTAQYLAAEEYGYLTGERPIPRFTAKIPWVKWSGRSFVVGTNTMTILTYDKCLKATLRRAEMIAAGQIKLKAGEAFDIQEDMDDYGKAIAWMTQRASLGKAKVLAPEASAVFFAARSKLGRFLTPKLLIDSNPRVRAFAWKNLALFVGVTASFVMLGKWLGLWDVETDPRNAEFMSIRIGNLRIDPWAGNRQFVVFYARLLTGTGVSSVTGAEYEVNPIGALTNFFRTSLAPLSSIILDFWTGENFLGEKVDIKNAEQWLKRVAPFAIQDVWEAFKDSWQHAAIAVIPAIFGEGVQTYSGDWKDNIPKLGLPKYLENTGYGLMEPVYDWADFYSDTASQFKGVDPATLTDKKGFDPKVRLVVETARSIEESSIIPNVKLISMNADPSKGKTFADYYQIWQARQKLLGDEKALKAFDADERNSQAYLGNISQSQFVLLTQYWSITDKKKQADFLASHPELSQNPREEWLKSHPEDNARQALIGKVKVLTQKAYDIAQKLIKDYDIPDNAVSQYLPPAEVAKSYFERNDIVDKWGSNSWEDQLIRAKNPKLNTWLELGAVDTPIASLELKVKNRPISTQYDDLSDQNSATYIADEKKRAEAVAKLKTDNPVFVDDLRRIEAIEKGTDKVPTPDTIIKNHVDYGKIQDVPGVGSSSAESMLFRVDNPEYNKWRMDADVWGDQTLKPVDETKIPVWRIEVKNRTLDTEYKALIDEEAKTAYLQSHPEYYRDLKRIDAYNKGFTGDIVETYADYYTQDLKGYEDDWFLMEHKEFYDKMVEIGGWQPKDFSKVPTREVSALYDTYETLTLGQARMDYRLAHPDLDAWLVSAKGMKPATKKTTTTTTKKTTTTAGTPWEEFAKVKRFMSLF